MSHIALRPEQARQLLTLMHTPFRCEIGEERQDFALGKGEPMVPVVHFRRPEQRNLQRTHANPSKINACPIQVSCLQTSTLILQMRREEKRRQDREKERHAMAVAGLSILKPMSASTSSPTISVATVLLTAVTLIISTV